MSSIIFDIETLGFPLETFDEVQQDYLLKFADTDEKRTLELQKFALSALTARIIAIGMMNPDTSAGKVYYHSNAKEQFYSDDGLVHYVSGTEEEILTEFWNAVQRYNRFITFNGRAFDCPFIIHRSMILGIKPTRNLMPYRYSAETHIDLLEQLTFYGVSRKYNLDFYCKAFGVKSPKSEGITGLDLGDLVKAERFRDIAKYCARDIYATVELYKKIEEFLKFEA
jgi:hypothetical protein